MYKIALLAVLTALTGCATPHPQVVVHLTSTFDAAKARELLQPGTNTIKGSALIRQNGGAVVTCAGLEVHLNPATEYARERMSHRFGSVDRGRAALVSPVKFASTDPEYLTMHRSVVCDAQGYFKFERVADGEFFLLTTITWKAGQYNIQGAGLMQRVTVAGGEVKEVVLAP